MNFDQRERKKKWKKKKHKTKQEEYNTHTHIHKKTTRKWQKTTKKYLSSQFVSFYTFLVVPTTHHASLHALTVTMNDDE